MTAKNPEAFASGNCGDDEKFGCSYLVTRTLCILPVVRERKK